MVIGQRKLINLSVETQIAMERDQKEQGREHRGKAQKTNSRRGGIWKQAGSGRKICSNDHPSKNDDNNEEERSDCCVEFEQLIGDRGSLR